MTTANRIRIFFPPYTPAAFFDLTPFGRKLTEDNQIIAREERASSGKLRRDIIARKKVFTLSYSSIKYEGGLRIFEHLYHVHSGAVLKFAIMKPSVAYPPPLDGVVERTYDVLMSGFNAGRLTIGKHGIWENVSVTFTEI